MRKPEDSVASLTENDGLFHKFSKPSWSQSGLLIHKRRDSAPSSQNIVQEDAELVSAEGCSIRASSLAVADTVCLFAFYVFTQAQ